MSGLRWWWVRHAPSAGAAGAVGWSDPPADLSDTAALARLAARLPEAAVLSSDLSRARATADALGLPGLRLPDCPAFRELHFGAWEGRGFDMIETEDPVAAAAFWSDPGPARAPGGEGWNDLMARVGAEIARRNAAATGDLVVVAHGGTIRAALALALALPPAAAFGFRIDPLSLTRLDWLAGPQAWAVDRVNQPA